MARMLNYRKRTKDKTGGALAVCEREALMLLTEKLVLDVIRLRKAGDQVRADLYADRAIMGMSFVRGFLELGSDTAFPILQLAVDSERPLSISLNAGQSVRGDDVRNPEQAWTQFVDRPVLVPFRGALIDLEPVNEIQALAALVEFHLDNLLKDTRDMRELMREETALRVHMIDAGVRCFARDDRTLAILKSSRLCDVLESDTPLMGYLAQEVERRAELEAPSLQSL